jgi:hypothetical protein
VKLGYTRKNSSATEENGQLGERVGVHCNQLLGQPTLTLHAERAFNPLNVLWRWWGANSTLLLYLPFFHNTSSYFVITPCRGSGARIVTDIECGLAPLLVRVGAGGTENKKKL